MILPIESNVYVETERLPRAVVVKGNRDLRGIRTHLRRIGVLILNFIFNHSWVYFLIGFLNKNVFNKSIKSLFMLYPANEKYTRAYVYAWYARSMRWEPRLVGFLKQNGRWGLIFGISSTEKDFLSSENNKNLEVLEARLEKIRRTIGAEQKTFAGILPGILASRKLVTNPVERDVTVKAVMKAITEVKNAENILFDIPVIVLGGHGFIGAGLVESGGQSFRAIDAGMKEEFKALVEEFYGKPIILLNVTKRGAISDYLSHLWPGVIVLNEVYPEPNEREVMKIKATGAICYHIAGAKGKAWPSFPRGYAGGIPCCASFWPDGGQGYKIVLKKL